MPFGTYTSIIGYLGSHSVTGVQGGCMVHLLSLVHTQMGRFATTNLQGKSKREREREGWRGEREKDKARTDRKMFMNGESYLAAKSIL